MPFGVRTPNAFLVVSFARPLNPFTTPDELVPLAWVHQPSRNFSAQAGFA